MSPSHSKKNWYLASICLVVIMCGILFYTFTSNFTHVVAFFHEVNSVLAPIYAGGIISFLLLPIHEYLYLFFKKDLRLKDEGKREGLSNGLAVLLSILLLFFIIYLLIALLAPQIYLSVANLFRSLPEDLVVRTPTWLSDYFATHPEQYLKIQPTYDNALSTLNEWIQLELVPMLKDMDQLLWLVEWTVLPNLGNVVFGVSQFVGGLFSFITDSLVAIIAAVYLLARKRTFAAQGKKLVYAFTPLVWADFLLDEVRNAYRIMSGFIGGKLLDSFIIGIITLIGSHMLQFPYAILIATVIGITNVIPFFGPFIGGVPCGVLIFFVSPVKCLYFIVFIIALQQFDGNILGPKILGDSTGLGSFWVLFSIILFGGIFGLSGMLLGVPVFAIFYSMLSRLVRYLLKRKYMPEETALYLEKKVTPYLESEHNGM